MAAPVAGHVSDPSDPRARRTGLALLAILVLGAALRLHHFAEPSLWLDEYGTSWAVAADTYGGVVHRTLLAHNQSPFFYLLAKASTDLFGPGPAALRLPSILLGIALVAVAFFLAGRLFRDPDAPWIAALVFALSERLVWYSQNGRSLALALLCGTLSFLFYAGILRRDTTLGRVAWVVSTAAAFYAHYLFGFVVVVQAVHLLWRRGREAASRRSVVSALALALAAAPGAWQFFQVVGRRRQLDWVGAQGWDHPLRMLLDFLDPLVFCAVGLGVLFVRAGRAAAAPQESDEARPLRHVRLLACWLLLPWPVFALLPPLFDTHLLYPRYLALALPAALLTLAWLLLQAPRGWPRRTVVAVFVLTAFAFNLLPAFEEHGVFARRPREGWTESAQYLDLAARPDDLVLYTSGLVEADQVVGADPELASYFGWPLLVHLKPELRGIVRNLPARRGPATEAYVAGLLEEASRHDRVWVAGRNAIVRAVGEGLVRQGFREADRRRFHQVDVYELRRR